MARLIPFVVLLIACSDPSSPARAIDAFEGTWVLESKAGHALPYSESASATDTVRFVSSSLELSLNSTYLHVATYRVDRYRRSLIGGTWYTTSSAVHALHYATATAGRMMLNRQMGEGPPTLIFDLRADGSLARIDASSMASIDERWVRE